MPLTPRRLIATLALALSVAAPWRVATVAAAGEPHPALALIEEEHWKRARTLLEAEQKSRPDDPTVLWALAEVRAQFGELDAAEKLAERAVALAPKDARAHAALADIVGEKAGRAGALKALGLAKRFRKTAEAAIALDPTLIGPRQGLMEFHMRAPGIAGGDRKQARVMVDEIARLDAAKGELARARLEQMEKDTTRVEAHYRRAVELAPGSIDARLTLAVWCATPDPAARGARARWAEAEQQAREARRLAPGRAAPLTLLAQVYAAQGKFAELEALLAAASQDCPDNRGPWYSAGRTLLLEGKDLPRAEQYFRHYLEQEPEGGSPSHAHAHWRLAHVLEKQGRKGDAMAELQVALRLKPDLDEAKKDLKRLRG